MHSNCLICGQEMMEPGTCPSTDPRLNCGGRLSVLRGNVSGPVYP